MRFYLLVELFRIHQKHWDELRQRQMPSLDQFRTDTPPSRSKRPNRSRKSWRN
jgi:hypothetical protein